LGSLDWSALELGSLALGLLDLIGLGIAVNTQP